MTTGTLMGKKITSADNLKAILAVGGISILGVISAIFYAGQTSQDITSRVQRNEKDIQELKLNVSTYTASVVGIQKDVAVIQTTLGAVNGQLSDIKETLKSVSRK